MTAQEIVDAARRHLDEMDRIRANDDTFMAKIRKKDYIDVEFRVVDEPKLLPDRSSR